MGKCTAGYTVRHVKWSDARDELSAVRRAVFVVEQSVPEDLEWDEHDAEAVHALASTAAGAPIGTGRVLRDGRIGRMAVLSEWRGRGIGTALLRSLLDAARERGYAELKLHAQIHAIGFYARHGFAVAGDEFMEAGIPHREMLLRPPY
jgi:predicted GNAT family N-acyltransferase